jgi:hypothetical protein
MKTGFFLLIQIFNQEMQKSLDFGTESVSVIENAPEILFLNSSPFYFAVRISGQIS